MGRETKSVGTGLRDIYVYHQVLKLIITKVFNIKERIDKVSFYRTKAVRSKKNYEESKGS